MPKLADLFGGTVIHFLANYPPFASIAKGEVFVLLYVCYPTFASIAKGEVFVLLYVCFFLFVCSVNDFSATRGPIHAIFCMRA